MRRNIKMIIRFPIWAVAIILLFLSVNCFSQTRLDFGEIQGNDLSKCIDTIDGKICHSKNQLEIRLTKAILLSGSYESIVLAYNGIKWTAVKYEGDWIHDTVVKFDLQPIRKFEAIFSALKENKIFTLPDQEELNAKGSVDDGSEFSLSFKAKNKFRTYHFSNPDTYQKYNKNLIEFENYINIVEILFNWLKKEESKG